MAKLVTVNNADKTVTRKVFLKDEDGMDFAIDQARTALSVVTDDVEVVEEIKRGGWETHISCDC